MANILKTDLSIICTCNRCGLTYFATLVYGGIPIDEDSTMTIAEAYEKGDKVEFIKSRNVNMGMCKCID